MQIISGTTQFYIEEPTAVVLGKFDGVHIGHQRLVAKIIQQKQKGLKTVVFTFDKSPVALFSKEEEKIREICTAEEKRHIFEAIGVDVLVEFPLNPQTAAILPDEFVTEILQKQMHCKFLAAGEDVSFGHLGAGNAVLLSEYSQKGMFSLELMKKITLCEVMCEKMPLQKYESEECMAEAVSATYIRQQIREGNMEVANVLLGRAFSIAGKVVHGNHLGSTVFSMPTANVVWPKQKVLPAFGVYFTQIDIEKRTYYGITNVGTKPTVAGSDAVEVLAETYLYDFSSDIYGKEIVVRFYHFHRPEQKFSDFEALKERLSMDMEAGKRFWSKKQYSL